MNASPELIRFVGETRACAMQMLSNAAYIQKELSGLEMPDSLRDQIGELCTDLIGSKHDLISEAVELEEALSTEVSPDRILSSVNMILGWIQDDVSSIHQCVEAVNDAVKCGTASGSVSMLIMESAVNIFTSTPARPSICDQLSEDDREEEMEDDEQDDDTGYDPNCYAFNSEDSYPVSQLIDGVRDVINRPELSPETLEELRVFLFAMERLPLVTPAIRMSLGLRLDQGGESDWIEIRMEEDVFTLGRGSWIDGDADTETVFEVGLDYRDGDAFQASNFALSFISCAEDVCREVVIDDSSDKPFKGWDLVVDKSRWSSLPCSFF